MRTVRDVMVMVGGAALFVYSLVTASSSPLAYMLGMAMLCLPIVMHGDRRRERADVPAPVTRPDADVAQYLNDDDRKWLGGHGWTAPTDEAGVEPKRSSWQTDLDRRIRAQLPISSHPRMAAGGVRVTPSTGSASYHVTRRATMREGVDDRRRIPVPRNVNLVIPNDHEREAVMTLAATVLKARVPVGSIRDGDSIPVRLCVTCDGLHTPVTALRTCTC